MNNIWLKKQTPEGIMGHIIQGIFIGIEERYGIKRARSSLSFLNARIKIWMNDKCLGYLTPELDMELYEERINQVLRKENKKPVQWQPPEGYEITLDYMDYISLPNISFPNLVRTQKKKEQDAYAHNLQEIKRYIEYIMLHMKISNKTKLTDEQVKGIMNAIQAFSNQ